MLKRLTLTGLMAVAFTGCSDEAPVGLDSLVPENAVITFEAILDAPAFLIADTSIGGFSQPSSAGFVVVAEDAGGALDSHALVRLPLPPASVTYTDSTGTSRTDTSPTLLGGEVVIRLDTTRALPTEPVSLALHSIAEAWDPASATWELRVDSGGVTESWTQPGGTPGALLDTTTLQVGADSAVFSVDSTTLALWSDTSDASRGALISSTTPGTRVRIGSLRLRFQARPSARPDTVVTDSVAWQSKTYITSADPVRSAEMFVGGRPTWRSYLRFARIDTVGVTGPCADGSAGCTYRLSDVMLNYGALLLKPVAPPAGFELADTLYVAARAILGGVDVPLARAPLGDQVSETILRVAPDAFATGGGSDGYVELPITNSVALLAGSGSTSGEAGTPEEPALALLDLLAGDQFGLAAFGGAGTADGPKLRVIVSVISEDQIP